MSNPYETGKVKNASVLGSTLKFVGELTADEDLLIQGHIEGSIKHTSNLTVGREGTVNANVSAEYIAVEGTVKGDLTSSHSVTVHESANIDGNIYSPTVSLLEGATFNGRIDMTGKKRADAQPAEERQAKQGEAKSSAAEVEAGNPGKSDSGSTKKSAKPQKSSASAA